LVKDMVGSLAYSGLSSHVLKARHFASGTSATLALQDITKSSFIRFYADTSSHLTISQISIDVTSISLAGYKDRF